ncbi:MAG: thiamine phosphate synthase [Sphingomonadaceae bacterium]
MSRRHPRIWLMTDERMGAALFPALARLPRGAGIVFRHYALPAEARRHLFDRVRSVARQRGLVLFLAGPGEEALRWGADGSHGTGGGKAGLPRSAPAHDLAESRRAAAAGADLLFVSPVFATRSHPGAPVLGPLGYRRLAGATRLPAIALGGMSAMRARMIGARGWAAIDHWLDEAPGA